MDYKERYECWLASLSEDDPLRKELVDIQDDDNEIKERFYQDLSFGTAGLRGIVGAGTNRMNFYTVGKATQGIADYIKEHGQEAMDRGVVIAHDPRHFSKEFSHLTASILVANGIKAYVFPDLRPTPELAYMVTKLGTIAGINITASHNPKIYNGYKAYWEDGCQVSSAVADGMTEKINAVDAFKDVKKSDFSEGVKEGKTQKELEEEAKKAGIDLDPGYKEAMEEAIQKKEEDSPSQSSSFIRRPKNIVSSIASFSEIGIFSTKQSFVSPFFK